MHNTKQIKVRLQSFYVSFFLILAIVSASELSYLRLNKHLSWAPPAPFPCPIFSIPPSAWSLVYHVFNNLGYLEAPDPVQIKPNACKLKPMRCPD